jgi:hypothetical protein
VTKKDRKAAILAFRDALTRHDEATRLADLEARVRELEQWPEQFRVALLARLPEIAAIGRKP